MSTDCFEEHETDLTVGEREFLVSVDCEYEYTESRDSYYGNRYVIDDIVSYSYRAWEYNEEGKLTKELVEHFKELDDEVFDFCLKEADSHFNEQRSDNKRWTDADSAWYDKNVRRLYAV